MVDGLHEDLRQIRATLERLGEAHGRRGLIADALERVARCETRVGEMVDWLRHEDTVIASAFEREFTKCAECG